MFRFKAITASGAIIDGSTSGTSREQVRKQLVRQGLIPLAVDAKSSVLNRLQDTLTGWYDRFNDAA